ncbi:MAG: hypothetical protein Q4D99_03815 [Bacillota bacterium]|nr:hypothetical protein [Bacillota bacterium]
MDIIKITIKGASGYGPVDEAYEDKDVLTENAITYEYKPHAMAQSETEYTPAVLLTEDDYD